MQQEHETSETLDLTTNHRQQPITNSDRNPRPRNKQRWTM